MNGDSSRRTQAVQFLSLVAPLALTVACSSSPGESTGSTAQAMDTSVHPRYGITVFGGPGDEQPMACGEHSSNVHPWYAASSQRYGCGVRLRLENAQGACVVVQTEDAGPASWVEQSAGVPILDVGPDVAETLFGIRALGWSTLAANPGVYEVDTTVTSEPLGPCGPGGGGGGGDPKPECTRDRDCPADLVCVDGTCE